MKIRITRFAPHQNAKVIAVLMALSSLLFVMPMWLVMVLFPVVEGQARPAAGMFLLFPVMYLVLGYLMVALACWLYNLVCRYVGGIEYEARSDES
ncbi:MAG TPA: hypothetical protein VIM12_00695 [Noviherbaspirillum sp.]|jgi:hypothetical protein|uniref:hypothetical protein n=1 Tax=Noviherbaspirillum sp. TaxID=1926288 RepID=UPI002F9235F4